MGMLLSLHSSNRFPRPRKQKKSHKRREQLILKVMLSAGFLQRFVLLRYQQYAMAATTDSKNKVCTTLLGHMLSAAIKAEANATHEATSGTTNSKSNTMHLIVGQRHVG